MKYNINDHVYVTYDQINDEKYVFLQYYESSVNIIMPDMIIYLNVDDETRIDKHVFDLIFKLGASDEFIQWCMYLFIMLMMEKSKNVCQKTFKEFVYFYTINHDDINDEFSHNYGFLTMRSKVDDVDIKTLLDAKMLFFRKMFMNLNVLDKYEMDVLWTQMIDHDLSTKILFDGRDSIPCDVVDSYLYGVLKKTIPNVSDDISLLGRSLNVLNDIKEMMYKYADNAFVMTFYQKLIEKYEIYCLSYGASIDDFVERLNHQWNYDFCSIEHNNGVMVINTELYQIMSYLPQFVDLKDKMLTRSICINGHIISRFIDFFEMNETYDMKISRLMQEKRINDIYHQFKNDFSLHMKNDHGYNNEKFLAIKQKLTQMTQNHAFDEEILSSPNELQLIGKMVFFDLPFPCVFNMFMSLVDYIKIVYIKRMIDAMLGCIAFYESIDKWYKKVFRIMKFIDRNYALVTGEIITQMDPNQINDCCDPTKNKFIHVSFENAVFLYCHLQQFVRDFIHIHRDKMDGIYKHVNLESFRHDEPRKMPFYDKIEQLKAKMFLHMRNVSAKRNDIKQLEYMTTEKLEKGDFDNYVFFSKKKNCDLISQKLNNRKRNKYLRKIIK